MQIKISGNHFLIPGKNEPTQVEAKEFNRLSNLDKNHNRINKEKFKKRLLISSCIFFIILIFIFSHYFGAFLIKSALWSAAIGMSLGYVITKCLEETTSDDDILQSINKIISQYNYNNFNNVYVYKEGRSSFVVNSAGLIIMNEWTSRFGAIVLFPQNILSARINTDTELQTTTKQSGSFTIGAGKGVFGGYSTGRKAKSETVAVHKHTFELRYQLSTNSNVQLKTIAFGSNRIEAENLCDLIQNLR